VTTDQLHLGVPGGPLRRASAATARAPRTASRREAVASWLASRWHLVASVALVGVLLDLLLGGALTTVVDPRVHAAMASLPHTGPDLVAAHVLDHTGQRWLVTPLVVAAALWACRRRRSWSSLWMVVATIFVMNVVIAVAKFSLARGLAISGDPSLFTAGGQAFPSGHGANAASAAALLVVLVARARQRQVRRSTALVVVLVPSTVMTAVSLYLGFHWFSDLLAGALLGVLVVRAGVAVEARALRHRALRRRIGLPPLNAVTGPFDVREPCEAAPTGVGGLSARRVSVDRNPVAR